MLAFCGGGRVERIQQDGAMPREDRASITSNLTFTPSRPPIFTCASTETRENLRKEFLETEVPPDETIVGMQRSMLRTLGFNADHGVACLNDFPKDYPDDFKLQMRLRQFIQW